MWAVQRPLHRPHHLKYFRSAAGAEESKSGMFHLISFFCVRHTYFTPEETVGEDEVNDGEDHAENPPDQSYRLTILRSRCILDGQTIGGFVVRKYERKQANACASEQ